MLHLLSRAAWTVIRVVGVLSAAVASLLLLDRVNRPEAIVDPGVAAVDTTKRSRLLVLHIDSWRYETAVDSTIMPQVAALRARGASWEMETVFEGFTIPAVRAAFSGHAETQLVNFIQNFRFRALGLESFFQDASRLGKRTLIVAVEPFTQFGAYFEQRAPDTRGLNMYEADRLRPAMAMRGWSDEKFDIVVCHYESADWVAHETGVNSARYRREFAYADSLVAAFAASLGPSDYLLVYGDHGHSPAGEHKTGIDIPTFALLLGPDVARGAIVGPMPTTNLRYVASHAIGVTLRPGPYDTRQLSRVLPIAADSTPSLIATARRASASLTDYAIALVVAFGAVGLALLLVRGVPGEGLEWKVAAVLAGTFIAEVGLQHYAGPGVTVFPFVLIALGGAATRLAAAWRVAIVVLGVWFAARTTGASWVAAPPGLAGLIPLYLIAIAAKLVVLDGIAGRTRWRSTLAWATAIVLVELRVWDSPLAYAALLGAGVLTFVRGRAAADRRLAAVVILSSLLYFTLRLPLFQLAWIDLFLCGVWLLALDRDDKWSDALIVTGSFALTSGWLASGLEWGFLYAFFPAHLVELQVQYFLPFILAKLPLLLVLSLVVAGRRPTRRLVEVLLLYTGSRFALAWALRLGGADAVEIWPLAEQGMYLTTFLLAGVVWTWRPRAVPASVGAQA